MNIVQVGPYPLSADCIRGGVESSVLGLANELAKSHVVDVFDYPRLAGKDTVERQGLLTIHRYNNPGRYNQDAIDRGKEMLRDIVALHPDIVHIHAQGIQPQYLSLSSMPIKAPIILSVGSISQRKGHLFLIKSFEKVHSKIPTSRLIIAGSLAEETYLAKMREEIKKYHLQDSVDILTNIPQEELLQHYQTASIYALHSQEESQGIALVEAMAAGLPVVSTTVGGIPYVVKDEESGLLSEYGDIDSFANNIIRLLGDKNFRDKIAHSAREIAQNYSWTNIAQAIETTYNRVISDI